MRHIARRLQSPSRFENARFESLCRSLGAEHCADGDREDVRRALRGENGRPSFLTKVLSKVFSPCATSIFNSRTSWPVDALRCTENYVERALCFASYWRRSGPHPTPYCLPERSDNSHTALAPRPRPLVRLADSIGICETNRATHEVDGVDVHPIRARIASMTVFPSWISSANMMSVAASAAVLNSVPRGSGFRITYEILGGPPSFEVLGRHADIDSSSTHTGTERSNAWRLVLNRSTPPRNRHHGSPNSPNFSRPNVVHR